MYLRRKNPRQEKRNCLYRRVNFLLTNFRQRFRIHAKKIARIRQVANHVIRPFYGHLQRKQFKYIIKKSKKTKSALFSSNEVLLSHVENRLDVVIYRLNLAPTIL
jgi:ribosomal protein S4